MCKRAGQGCRQGLSNDKDGANMGRCGNSAATAEILFFHVCTCGGWGGDG